MFFALPVPASESAPAPAPAPAPTVAQSAEAPGAMARLAKLFFGSTANAPAAVAAAVAAEAAAEAPAEAPAPAPAEAPAEPFGAMREYPALPADRCDAQVRNRQTGDLAPCENKWKADGLCKTHNRIAMQSGSVARYDRKVDAEVRAALPTPTAVDFEVVTVEIKAALALSTSAAVDAHLGAALNALAGVRGTIAAVVDTEVADAETAAVLQRSETRLARVPAPAVGTAQTYGEGGNIS